MSHYTTIRTKYNNKKVFKKVLDNLKYSYTQHNDKKEDEFFEIFIPMQGQKERNPSKNYFYNFLTFYWSNDSYIMITDPQSWTQKSPILQFLKNLQLNYSYRETVNQAMKVGFQYSRTKSSNTRFVFQRYVQIKSFL